MNPTRTLAAVLATAVTSGLARANEQIVVRSGQVNGAPGSPGQLDDTIRSIHIATCNTPLANHAFTPADFAAAAAGPSAMLCQPIAPWPPSIPQDPAARWINWGNDFGPHQTTNPASVLYAIPFQVTTAVVDTATVTLAWSADDQLGDYPSPGVTGPNPVGVYVNGVPLEIGFSTGPSPHSQACVPIQSGANVLYIYQRDTGCSDAGLMFSCTIDVDTPGTCETVFCTGDGRITECPCGNNGLLGRGCENALTTGGGWLTRTGVPSLGGDTIQFTCSGERPTSLSIVLQGTSAIAPTSYGDGLRCTGGALKRLYSKNAVGGQIVAPSAGEPSVSARSAAKGDPLFPGATRYYQVYYRDPEPTFCPGPSGGTFNVSNGIVLNWGA